MSPKRTKMVQSLNISEDVLNEMKKDAEWYAKLSVPEIRQKMKFSYKRITKILFAEYFLSI